MNRYRANAKADHELRLHRLLSWQLRLLPLSLLGLALMLVIGLLLGEIALLRAATAVLAGIPLGLILSRVQRVAWSRDAQLLTATIDALGVVMLLLFWSLLTLRARWLLGVTDSLVEVAAIGMATASGILMTRLWSLRQAIQRALATLADGDERAPPA